MDEIKDLLEDIQCWMSANDYECGEEGSEIWDRIEKLLVSKEVIEIEK